MVTNELAALKASFDRAKAFLNAGDAKMAEKICRSGLKQITSGDPNLQVLLSNRKHAVSMSPSRHASRICVVIFGDG